MLKPLLVFAFLTIPLLAKETDCPQIDRTKLDADLTPLCPEVVRQTTAFAVTRCAYNQAKDWHAATAAEEKLMKELVQNLKDDKTAEAIDKADRLKLQTCRSKKDGDSFLLMYTKPGVRDYSGPFLMFREGGKTSGIVIHAPHDGQDGTTSSTRAAFADSNALALISNGHPRRISGEAKGPYRSDWAHTSADLGYTAFLAFRDKFETSVHLHIHGLAANRVMITDSVGWKSKHVLREAFHAATVKAIGDNKKFDVVNWHFNGWISGIAMTRGPNGKGRHDNERWVGAEVAVAIHSHTNILTKMVRNLEEDYLKKPREIPAVQLEKAVAPVEGDTVEASDEANIAEVDEKPLIFMAQAAVAQPADIEYVPMPMPEKPREVDLYVQTDKENLVHTCKSIGNKMKQVYEHASRHKIKITPSFGTQDRRAPGPNKLKLVFKPGASSHVPIIGNAASAAHEFGHEMGLGHANTRIWDDVDQGKIKQARKQRDPFDTMVSAGGGPFVNAAHMHHKGWFSDTEEAYAKDGATYTLTVLNSNARDYKSLKALYYKTAGERPREVFLSYGHVKSKGWHAPDGMPGTAVAIHSGAGGTYFEGLIGLKPEKLNRYGLIIEVSNPTATTVTVKVTKDPTWVQVDNGDKEKDGLTEDDTEEELVVVDPKVNLLVDESPEKNDVIDEEIEMQLPAIPASLVADSIVYAPYPKGNMGVKKLACVGVSYSNDINNYVTAERCLKSAQNVSDFYFKNSGGRLKLEAAGYHMDYPGNGWEVFGAAELEAKKKFQADYYIIPNIFRKGGNHASNKIAHLTQFLGWLWAHELGHLLGLGHSGRYTYDKDGKPHLENYGDDQSPMGNNGYNYLTGAEYYAMGWLGKTGTALYTQPGQTFELTNIKSKKIDGPLFGIVVKAENFKGQNLPRIKGKHSDAFISFPAECPKAAKSCVALHLFQGGGSQRVAMGITELQDPVFTGLDLKVISFANDKVKVSVDFLPLKP